MANSMQMKALLEKLITKPKLLKIITELINPYIKSEYQYYSNSFLFTKLKNKHNFLLKDIESNIPENQKNFTPQEIVKIVKSLLSKEFKNENNWKVIIGHKYRLHHAKLTIHIANRKMTKTKLKSILFHELVVHFYRAQKSYELSNKICINDYLVFEEGLAKMFETIGTDHENIAKFKFQSIILFLYDLGLDQKYFQEIFELLNYSNSIQNRINRKLNLPFRQKFKTLIYIIGFNKVQYFSTAFEQSKFQNNDLYQAFTKISDILIEYKFNPLNFDHIKSLNSLSMLNLTKNEINAYKRFVNSKKTKNIEKLSKGISEHRFSPNRVLS